MRALALALAALLCSGCMAHQVAFPVFGAGPLTNLGDTGNENSVDRARTNASAHVSFSLVVPLLAQRIGGRKAMRWSVLGLTAGVLTYEAAFHAPPGPLGPDYNAELRTGLLTLLAPALTYLLIDWLLEAP